MAVHVLENAVEMPQRELTLMRIITLGKRAALQAITIINYVVGTKFAMMPPEEKQRDAPEPALSTPVMPVNAENCSQTSVAYFLQEALADFYGKYVKVLLHKGTVVKPSEVFGRHVIPPVTPLPNTTNCSPTLAAEAFLKVYGKFGTRRH